jgi:hypothetical protein
MAYLALAVLVAVIIVSVRVTRDQLNLFVITNLMTFGIVFIIPFVTPLVWEFEGESIASMAWLFAMTSVVAQLVGFLLGRSAPADTTRCENLDPERLQKAAKWALLLYGLTIAPFIVMVGPVAALTDARRQIYEATRVGYGHFYYVAGSFLMLFTLCGMFAFKRKWLVLVIAAVCSLPFGNKTRLLGVVNVALLYFLYFHPVREKLREARYTLGIGGGLVAFVVGAFWLTSHDLNTGMLIQFVAGFGLETQVNFSVLSNRFDNYFPNGHFYGRIFFEDNFVLVIPRILWSGKPLYFGSLHLSQVIYPVLTEADRGAPTFGHFGQPFADFGLAGLIQVATQQGILGWLLGRYETRAKQTDLRSFLAIYAIGFGGFVAIGGAVNLLFDVLVNLAAVAVFFRVARNESPGQLPAMPS